MKTFNLVGKVTISVYTSVKANSLEEAIKITKDRVIEKDNWSEKEQHEEVWVNNDYDGEVEQIEEGV